MNKLKAMGSSALLALAAMAGMGMSIRTSAQAGGAELKGDSNAQLNQVKNDQHKKGNKTVAGTGFAHALRRLMGGNGGYKPSYPNGPGWSQAQVQRMARKKKNQAKNKRNHRG